MFLDHRQGWDRPFGVVPIATTLALGACVAGCDSAPTGTPTPPSGGQEYVLSFEQFELTIHPILSNRGCDTAGDCHGGGIRGTFELSPPDDKDVLFDFEQAVLQVDPYAPADSPLLTKPLAEAAGGEPHSHEPFADSTDVDYQAILAWINDGEFQ